MITNMINSMIQLSNEKKVLLESILDFTKKQKSFIQDEDMDSLTKVLSEKDEIMKNIDLLDLDFISLYNNIKSMEDISSMEEIDVDKYSNVKLLKSNINEISLILNNIRILDNDNTRMMKTNLENIKSGLKHVKEAKNAYKGYNYEAPESMLIDEKK